MRKTPNITASVVSCILFFVSLLYIAQPSYAQWAATYGGTVDEAANSIRQTSDGGYIVAGRTFSFGDGGAWVLKLDVDGNVQWQKVYENAFEANSIQQTSDGGYIVAGETFFGAGLGGDFWISKLNAGGNIQWQKTYGGGRDEAANSIQQTSDGGYIVAGDTESFGAGGTNFWVLRLDSSGNVQWQKTYGGGNDEGFLFSFLFAVFAQQTSDGGYIVAGGTESFGAGESDFWVLKLDSDGNIQWQKSYGGNERDVAFSIQQTSDDGYIVAGNTSSFDAGLGDFWVLKLDSSGIVQWQKAYGVDDVDGFSSASIQQTSDGGYIVAGDTDSVGIINEDFWVLKLDSGGNVQWQKTYGGSGAEGFWSVSIQQTNDEGYIAAGDTSSFGAGFEDLWVLKLKRDGTIDQSCDFIKDTNVSGIDSSATVTDTNANGADTFVTPQALFASVQDTNASKNILCPIQCDITDYSKGLSSIRIRSEKVERDKVSLRICVNEAFCDALQTDPEGIAVALNGCLQRIIPDSKLKATNRSKTRFRARSSKPNYVLKINCKKRWLKIRMKKLDLEDCVSNPVKVCVSVKDGPCLCAEEEFTEKRRNGRLKKLFSRVKQACPPF